MLKILNNPSSVGKLQVERVIDNSLLNSTYTYRTAPVRSIHMTSDKGGHTREISFFAFDNTIEIAIVDSDNPGDGMHIELTPEQFQEFCDNAYFMYESFKDDRKNVKIRASNIDKEDK